MIFLLCLLIAAVCIVWLTGEFFFAIGTTIALVFVALGLLSKILQKAGKLNREAGLKRSVNKRRTHLRELSTQIDTHLGALQIAKTEADLDAHMEALISAMDELSSCSERLLEDAGVTKSNLPQQREYAFKCYDATLAKIKNQPPEHMA